MPAALTTFSRFSCSSCLEKIGKLCIAVFIGLTGLIQLPAHAENNYFGIHGPSYHDGGLFNNANYGLYLVHQGFTGGFYDNSLNRQTFYLGYAREWDLPVNPLINSISLMGSLATGYYTEQTPYEWMPMGVLSFKHSFDSQHGMRLSYLPGVGKSTANYVLHLSYEFRLK